MAMQEARVDEYVLIHICHDLTTKLIECVRSLQPVLRLEETDHTSPYCCKEGREEVNE